MTDCNQDQAMLAEHEKFKGYIKEMYELLFPAPPPKPKTPRFRPVWEVFWRTEAGFTVADLRYPRRKDALRRAHDLFDKNPNITSIWIARMVAASTGPLTVSELPE